MGNWLLKANELDRGRRPRRVPAAVILSVCWILAVPASSGAEPALVLDRGEIPMVVVPSATFVMGDSAGQPDARPPHEVHVDGFLIDRTEVTYAQFREFLVATPHWRKGEADPSLVDADYLRDWAGLDYPVGKANHPVVWVSWSAARAYARWRGCRLPTEAEWELAARGTDGRPYPWGAGAPDSGGVFRCNFRAAYPVTDGYENTAPVGEFPLGASPCGALDMAGNVWEWVADWHDPEYYSESPRKNPTGPPGGTYRVLRGGSWSVPANWVRATIRMRAYPVKSSDQVGFRCVRELD